MCVCVLVVVYTLIGVRLSGLHINIAFFLLLFCQPHVKRAMARM